MRQEAQNRLRCSAIYDPLYMHAANTSPKRGTYKEEASSISYVESNNRAYCLVSGSVLLAICSDSKLIGLRSHGKD